MRVYSFQFSQTFAGYLLWWRLALITLWNSSLIVYFSQVVPTFLNFLRAKLVNKINNSFENVIISGKMKKVSECKECRVRRAKNKLKLVFQKKEDKNLKAIMDWINNIPDVSTYWITLISGKFQNILGYSSRKRVRFL